MLQYPQGSMLLTCTLWSAYFSFSVKTLLLLFCISDLINGLVSIISCVVGVCCNTAASEEEKETFGETGDRDEEFVG